MEPAKELVFQSDFAGAEDGDAPALRAIKKALSDDVAAKPAKGRMCDGSKRSGVPPQFELRLSPEAGVFFTAGPVIGRVLE